MPQSPNPDFKMQPRLRSLVSRSSKAVLISEQDPETGEWRNRIKMSRTKFDEMAKGIFLEEYSKWGRMGEAAAAAGVTSQTVRKHMEEDEDFAEAFLVVEGDYREKLVGHHQDLLFNGTQKNHYDRSGELVSSETIYPIRLIEMELKKHDSGYREKQELEVRHGGGVLLVPAEMGTIEDWEKKFGEAKDITPKKEMIEGSSSSSSKD